MNLFKISHGFPQRPFPLHLMHKLSILEDRLVSLKKLLYYSLRLLKLTNRETAPIRINIHARPPLKKISAAVLMPQKSTIHA